MAANLSQKIVVILKVVYKNFKIDKTIVINMTVNQGIELHGSVETGSLLRSILAHRG